MRAEILTTLELTSPAELVPGRPAPVPLELEEIGIEAAPLLRSTYVRIGAPHAWTGRTAWSDDQWEEELSRAGVRAWIARVDGELAGFFELEAGPGADAGIVVFGLVPEFVGRGFGGELLTRATQLARGLGSPEERPPRRRPDVVARPSAREAELRASRFRDGANRDRVGRVGAARSVRRAGPA